jgi:hypothetical protein
MGKALGNAKAAERVKQNANNLPKKSWQDGTAILRQAQDEEAF